MAFSQIFRETKLFATFVFIFFFTARSINKAIKASQNRQSSNISRGHEDYEKETSSDKAKRIAQKGDAAMEAKKWDDAIGFYTTAIRVNSGNNTAIYFTNRAEAYLEMGCINSAKDDCDSAIRLDEKNLKAYLLRRKVQEMLGYHWEADEV